MTEKTEALRLADELILALRDTDVEHWDTLEEAAAELRRLHEAHDWQYRMAGERLRRVEKLETQRDALLEACRAMLTFIERHAPRGLQPEPGSPVAKARAAVKAVEEEQK